MYYASTASTAYIAYIAYCIHFMFHPAAFRSGIQTGFNPTGQLDTCAKHIKQYVKYDKYYAKPHIFICRI